MVGIVNAPSFPQTIAAGSYLETEFNASKSGYKIVGIIGINKTGSSQFKVAPYRWAFDNNNVAVDLANYGSYDVTINSIAVAILYRRIS